MERKRFVSWRRVSTQKQGKSGLGLEAQKEIIHYFVKRDGGVVIADYSECYTGKELSGCIQLRKAMEHSKREHAVLVIAKSDRFRNCQEALGILDEMGEGNIEFCDLPHSDRFTLTLFWALAEREALITSIRTKQALQAKRDRGETVGNPNATITSQMRANSINSRKEEARLNVNNRKAYTLVRYLRQQNKSYAEIARELNDSGYCTATGKLWQTVQVQRLIALYT